MNSTKQLSFTNLEHVVLIGGGDLLVNSAQLLLQNNYKVSVILAPRHLDEPLITHAKLLSEYLIENNISYSPIPDINTLSSNELKTLINKNTAALCFGPAWIFNKTVINAFDQGMYNINAIPIPHYLGGAHYTWQLLNKNNEGGCFLQSITEKVDQGDIIAQHKFTLSQEAITPDDFFIENIKQGTLFISQWVNDLTTNKTFSPTTYDDFNQQRIYLPRLRTDKQGYINWQWPIDDIISFCQGFNSPYQGAATFINEEELRLTNIKKVLIKHDPMHPFATGLIIRKLEQHIIVAAIGGFLEISNIPTTLFKSLKEGMRLHTPLAILEQAMQYQVKLTADGFKD